MQNYNSILTLSHLNEVRFRSNSVMRCASCPVSTSLSWLACAIRCTFAVSLCDTCRTDLHAVAAPSLSAQPSTPLLRLPSCSLVCYQASDGLVVFENDHINAVCTKLLRIAHPSFGDMNRIIAHVSRAILFLLCSPCPARVPSLALTSPPCHLRCYLWGLTACAGIV